MLEYRRTPVGVVVGLVAADLLLTTACALVPVDPPSTRPAPVPAPPAPVETPRPQPAPKTETQEPEPPAGIFHVVQSGQTLWRIARAYGITIASLAEANNIPNPERLEVGQALFIPGAQGAVDVPAYPAPIPDFPGTLLPDPSIPHRADGYVWPVSGQVLAPFGQRRRRSVHRGLDIRGGSGDDVLAARAGRVVFAGEQRGYGRVVVLDHGDGEQTVYAHNSKNLVKAGDEVGRGVPVALVGRSGNATTEHVHFEVRRAGVPLDPMPLLPVPQALEAKK